MRNLSLQLALLMICAPGLSAQVRRPSQPVNLDFASSQVSRAGVPGGWYAAGSAPNDFLVGLDSQANREGAVSAYIESKHTALLSDGDFGTLMQSVRAKDYRGKRLRLSGYIRTDGVAPFTAEQGAVLWMRVDGKSMTLAFDNMYGRGINGTTDWTLCEIVLDVPEESKAIAFGMLLPGYGKAWVAGLGFEEVTAEVPTTRGTSIARALGPVIDQRGVEAGIERYWEIRESAPEEYDFGEQALNNLGYDYLNRGETEVAIAIFKLNVKVYPDAFNTYDSLAEGYMDAGQTALAIQYYERSLELNPDNENARQMIERLGADVGEEGAGV